jgi:hypothetical protein
MEPAQAGHRRQLIEREVAFQVGVYVIEHAGKPASIESSPASLSRSDRSDVCSVSADFRRLNLASDGRRVAPLLAMIDKTAASIAKPQRINGVIFSIGSTMATRERRRRCPSNMRLPPPPRRDLLIGGAASPTIAAAVAGRANRGAATTWIPLPTISTRWSNISTRTRWSMPVTRPAAAKSRYICRHGNKRVARAVLIGAVPPLMLKTAGNRGGLPIEMFDGICAGVLVDRSQFSKDLSMPFCGYNRPDAQVSEGARETFWQQWMMAGVPAS